MRWWIWCPAVMKPKARTVTSFWLAVPRLDHASSSKDRNSARLALRTAVNSSPRRRLISPANSQRAVGEYPLCVDDVPKNFLHGPFPRRIAEVSVALSSPGKKLQHFLALRIENA